MGTFGQDWSSFQDPDPSTAGLGFAVVKRTEGLGYVNPDGVLQVAHARANGLVVGHYHYPHMANSPTAEADRFLSVAAPASGDFVVLDWEGYDSANQGVSFSTQIAYKVAWLAHVRAAVPQLQVGTYANTDYLNRDPKGAYGDFLWIATANRPAGQPGISHDWLFHQYGASGVDRDFCPLTLDQLRAWSHAKEDDMTPLQAKQLQELHDALVGFKGWDYANIDERKADPHSPDAWGKLGATLANSKATLTAVKAAAPVTLTDAQVAALAAQVVPVLVPQLVTALGHALDGTKP